MKRGRPRKVLPVGKLPFEHLRSLLRHLPKHDPRLLIGPQIGEDAAVIASVIAISSSRQTPSPSLLITSGVTLFTSNANDVAVLGARPLLFVVVLLRESRTTPELAETIN
jgi:hydrogenase expression/formation protein HypE